VEDGFQTAIEHAIRSLKLKGACMRRLFFIWGRCAGQRTNLPRRAENIPHPGACRKARGVPQHRRPCRYRSRDMRVLLTTFGSRGDVQPLLGLGVALRALGADARVCAPPDEEFAKLFAAAS